MKPFEGWIIGETGWPLKPSVSVTIYHDRHEWAETMTPVTVIETAELQELREKVSAYEKEKAKKEKEFREWWDIHEATIAKQEAHDEG